MATAERDYYELLGVARDGDRGRDQEGLPEARARAAPRRLAGARRSGALPRGRGGVRGALEGRDAPALRPLRPRGPAARRLPAERLRLLATSPTSSPRSSATTCSAQPRRPRARRRRRRRGRDRARRGVHRRDADGRGRGRGRVRACGGDGAEPGTEPVTCPTCGGTGRCSRSRAASSASSCARRPARTAAAPAAWSRHPAPMCDGAGRALEEQELEVEIPAGHPRRPAHPAPGEGHAGAHGGLPGDVYVLGARRPRPALRARGQRHLLARST